MRRGATREQVKSILVEARKLPRPLQAIPYIVEWAFDTAAEYGEKNKQR